MADEYSPTVQEMISRHIQESYAAKLTEEHKQRKAEVNYAGHYKPVGIPARPKETEKLPLDIMVDGVPYNTIGTISVLGTRDSGTAHNPDRAIAASRHNFALVRKPLSNEVFVTPLSAEAMNTGYAEISTEHITALPEEQGRGYYTNLTVGDTQWEKAQLSIQYTHGSYAVELNGNPGAMAMVAQPLPQHGSA